MEQTNIRGKISKETLKNIGFSDQELQNLCDVSVLEKETEEVYAFSYNKMFDYAERLHGWKKYEKAYACYQACYHVCQDQVPLLLFLIHYEVVRRNLEGAFAYFTKLYQNSEQREDDNFLLYLFHMSINIDEPYRTLAKSLRLEDCLATSEEPNYETLYYHEIKKAAFKKNFEKAAQYLEMLIQKRGRTPQKGILIQTLLANAKYQQDEFYKALLMYLNEENYETALAELQKQGEHYPLNTQEKRLACLLQDYLNIKQTGVLPEITILDTTNIDEAIQGKNYELAMQLYEEGLDKAHLSKNQNFCYFVLQSINLLKERFQYDAPLDVGDDVETFITKIKKFLYRGDFNIAFDMLHKYLRVNNQEVWEYVFVNLIKIDMQTPKGHFSRFKKVLRNLMNNKQPFYMESYIGKIYKALSLYEIEKAEGYIDIVTNAHILGYPYVSKEPFEPLLEQAKQERTEVLAYVEGKRKRLERDGIVLLKPMNLESRERLQKVLKRIPDIDVFSIDPEKDRQRMVLRYSPWVEAHDQLSGLRHESWIAYQKGDYQKSLAIIQPLLYTGRISSHVFARLGLAHMKLFHINLAIDYLTIATELSKREDGARDFTRLIASLKGDSSDEFGEQKPVVKIEESEFQNPERDYNIPNLDQIKTLLFCGTSLDEVVRDFSLSEDEVSLVLLSLAEDYYIREQYQEGDKLLKTVNQRKGKSKLTMSILHEIQQGKRFYKNRAEGKTLQLLPTL